MLAASQDGLAALVNSSPRLLAEGLPGTPAELLLRSAATDRTVHIGVTLLSPPEGFDISVVTAPAPVLPAPDTSELAHELEAAGVLDGLTSAERSSIIQQVWTPLLATPGSPSTPPSTLSLSTLPLNSLRQRCPSTLCLDSRPRNSLPHLSPHPRHSGQVYAEEEALSQLRVRPNDDAALPLTSRIDSFGGPDAVDDSDVISSLLVLVLIVAGGYAVLQVCATHTACLADLRPHHTSPLVLASSPCRPSPRPTLRLALPSPRSGSRSRSGPQSLPSSRLAAVVRS